MRRHDGTHTLLPICLARHEFAVVTRGRSFDDVTEAVAAWLATLSARDGLLNVFLKHGSASLTIQENSDPDIQAGLMAALNRLPPEGDHRHSAEGPDDGPAHRETLLTPVSLSIPVVDGKLALSRSQAIYLIEHRQHGSNRTVLLQFMGALS